MARYIDADAFVQKLKDEQSKRGTLRDYEIGYWNALTMAQAIVLSQPTADVVEVVRCRDCKQRETSNCPMYQEEYSEWNDDGYTEVDLIVTDNTEDDGFCHCGAKMDGDDNA